MITLSAPRTKNQLIGLFCLFVPRCCGKLILRMAAAAVGVPSQNMVSAAEYTAQLEQAGFSEVAVTPITAHVLPGFCSFVSAQRR